MTHDEARAALRRCVDGIEGGYEYLLAYAAQGVATDEGHPNSEQLRTYLQRMDEGMAGLESALSEVIGSGDDAVAFAPMLVVLQRDVMSARSALGLVRSRRGISSQLVDNFNASTHVRSLLTDLFLLDEAVKSLA
jgi:hypothetical protein